MNAKERAEMFKRVESRLGADELGKILRQEKWINFAYGYTFFLAILAVTGWLIVTW